MRLFVEFTCHGRKEISPEVDEIFYYYEYLSISTVKPDPFRKFFEIDCNFELDLLDRAYLVVCFFNYGDSTLLEYGKHKPIGVFSSESDAHCLAKLLSEDGKNRSSFTPIKFGRRFYEVSSWKGYNSKLTNVDVFLVNVSKDQ